MPEYISVTVNAPAGLPPMAATVVVHTETAEQFIAVLAAVPPEGEPRPLTLPSVGVIADLGGDTSLLIYAPKMTPQVAELAESRFVREALGQRAAAEDDPRGIGDGLGR